MDLSAQRYYVLGLSVIIVVGMMVVFSDGNMAEYDYTGIVHDTSSSENGFTFYLDTADTTVRCFSRERPLELGYYAVAGTESDDGSIFFVSVMKCLD